LVQWGTHGSHPVGDATGMISLVPALVIERGEERKGKKGRKKREKKRTEKKKDRETERRGRKN